MSPDRFPRGLALSWAPHASAQFLFSILIDRRYEGRIGRQFFWIIWYPLVYWIIGMLTTVVAVPKALFKRTGTRAVWESPDRGIR